MSTSTPDPVVWLPASQQVADLLRARTKDNDGRELGSWSETTRPTEYEVWGLIETAAGDVLVAVDMLRRDYPDEDGIARGLCAKRTAMLIELSYFPEQAAAAGSIYSEYRQQYNDGVLALINLLAGPPAGGSTYSVRTATTTIGALGDDGFRPWWVLNLPEPETGQPAVVMPDDPPGGKVVIGGSPPGDW